MTLPAFPLFQYCNMQKKELQGCQKLIETNFRKTPDNS